MFKPLTDDMLPREAPKPCEGSNAYLQTKPTVPEVSLVFGQESSTTMSSTANNSDLSKEKELPIKSYADWKKQVLPKVTYEPKVTFANPQQEVKSYGPPKVSLYPFRNAVSTANSYPQMSEQFSNIAAMNQGVMQSSANDMQYKRFLEENKSNGVKMAYETTNQDLIYLQSHPPNHHHQQNFIQMPQRRSLESMSNYTIMPFDSLGKQVPLGFSGIQNIMPQSKSKEDVLCICAGTQTDFSSLPPRDTENDYVTIDHFNRLMKVVEDLRSDQQRLLQFCETFLGREPKTNELRVKEESVQCEIPISSNCNTVKKPINLNTDCIIEESPQQSPKSTESPTSQHPPPPPPPTTAPLPPANNHFNRFIDFQIFQSPKTSKPIAQSTQYRPNTPKVKGQETAIIPALPRPTTEKSMVMNELALKYLPNDKINELLQELEISPFQKHQVQMKQQQAAVSDRGLTPLKELDNFIKSPNDISNASYKYLKKYRLLPEDEKNENSPVAYNQKHHSPFQRNTSPLVGRQNESPRLGASPSNPNSENNFEFNQFKNQPKYL